MTSKRSIKIKSSTESSQQVNKEFDNFINNKILKHAIMADFYLNGEKSEIHEIKTSNQPTKSFWDLARANMDNNDQKLDAKALEAIKNEYDQMLKQIILFVMSHTVKEVAQNFFTVDTQQYRKNKLMEYYNQANNKVDTFLKCYIGEDSFAKHPEYKNINLARTNADLKKILSDRGTREAFRLDILNSIISETLPTLATALNNELLATEQDQTRRFTLKQSTVSATLQKISTPNNNNSSTSILERSLTEKNLLVNSKVSDKIQVDSERQLATRKTIKPATSNYYMFGQSEETMPFAKANQLEEHPIEDANNDAGNWCCNIL